MMRLSVAALLALVLAAACATGGGGANRGGGSRDIILTDEIARSGAADAHSLVQALRPHWLQVRGAGRGSAVGVHTRDGHAAGFAEQSVTVYLNNARVGPSESLRQIPLAGVRYIRFFSPAQANLRWGAGNANGAILVSTEDVPRS
jgi:hypothetical protein